MSKRPLKVEKVKCSLNNNYNEGIKTSFFFEIAFPHSTDTNKKRFDLQINCG